MNKTLLIIIAGIVIVGGLIGYTLFGKQDTALHDDTGLAPHDDAGTATQNTTTAAPHDDTGSASHAD